MNAAAVQLYWMPVGAGTSRFQRSSLRVWEAVEAVRARRPRRRLYHSGLKIRQGGATLTLELMPEFVEVGTAPLLTGPIGLALAGRSRLFRYQLVCLEIDSFPDEAWAVDSPQTISDDTATGARLLELARRVPRYTWGRRVPGTSEMWTSDSVISWLLVTASADMSGVRIPDGGRAPGWRAGIELATKAAAPS